MSLRIQDTMLLVMRERTRCPNILPFHGSDVIRTYRTIHSPW